MSEGKVTRQDLDEFVEQTKPFHIIVMYAKWCGHCQDMIKKLGSNFKHHDKVTFLEEEQIDQSLLDHFPHVHVWENGVHRDGTLKEVYEVMGVN
jgi:thiol-disulfide isomerase/thioredoxin